MYVRRAAKYSSFCGASSGEDDEGKARDVIVPKLFVPHRAAWR